MSIRFRRRVKIAPGVHVNIGKTGLSVSAGKTGAQITVGKSKQTATVGLPGTGLSYTKTMRRPSRAAAPAEAPKQPDADPTPGRNLAIGIGAFICLGLLAKGCSML
jgi:hypothetical protein